MVTKLFKELQSTEPQRLLIYIIIYSLWGIAMNWFGQQVEIAKFTYWWQIITVYILYMVPISIFLRKYSFINQYAYGLIAMCFLEFGGYALGTSYIYPNNILDQLFGPHVFALGMAMFFGLYFPLGNMLVNWIYERLNNNR